MNQAASRRRSPASVRRLLLRLVLVVLVPLLLLQGGIYLAVYRNRLADEERVRLEIARGVAATFGGYINDVRRQESAIGAALAGLNPYTPEQAHNFLVTNGREYPSVLAWHWVNSDGRIIASSDHQAVNLNIHDIVAGDYFQKALDGQSWTISDMATDRVSGKPAFVISRGIADKDGTLRGVVSATVDVGKLDAHLLATHRSDEGLISVFDSRGVLVYDSSNKTIIHRTWRDDDVLLDAVLKSSGKNVEKSGTIAVPGDDKKYIAARVRIRDTTWVVGARRPMQEALADVRASLWIVTGLNLLVAIVTGAFAAKTSRTLIGQLRRLQSHAQAIGRGDFGHVVEGAGVSELAELATAFNQMGAAVRSSQEALEEANASLEQHVRERTAELAATVQRLEQTEQEVRAASLYARGLIEASLDPLVTISPEGKITDVNEATEVATGAPRHQLIGSDFSSYFTEPDLARDGYRKVLSEGLVRDYPLTIRHVSGRTIDVLYNAVVYRNEAGESQGVFAAARDVTDRKRVEAELEKHRHHLEELVQRRTGQLEVANAQLQAVFDVANVGMILIDDRGVVKRANHTISRWAGRELPANGDHQPGDIIGCVNASGLGGCGKTSHRSGCPIRNAIESVLRSGQPVHDVEAESVLWVNGTEERLWLDVSADPVVLDGKRNVIVAMNNVTALKRAKKETERLASFPTLNPNPIAEVDLEGRVHYVNPIAERLFPDLQQNGIAHPWLADWESVARGLQKGDSRVRVRELAVDEKYYEQTIHYVKEIERVRLYGLEITDRKRAEDALKRTADQLAKSNEQLEQFAYVASHDLQEPLRIVTGYVQLIERKFKSHLDADADQFLHYIVDGVERMQQLITDLLNYSRVGTHGAPFRAIKAQAVLDRVLANLKMSIDESGAMVTCGSLPIVQGDETQLVQLFQNLIGNGIKFHGDQPPRIDVSARRDGACWEFAVRDNGIGIDRQYWEQIFVIFQRLHTRQKYAGTGIGLAICKRIVERHGGRIWLDSQPGQGTTFYFTLP